MAKRPRLSSSSDLSEDEEDKPLAERVQPLRNGNGAIPRGRGGKKTGAKGSSGMTIGGQQAPPRDGQSGAPQVNGVNGAHPDGKPKLDELRMNHNQLARISTGVTVDAAAPSAHVRWIVVQPPCPDLTSFFSPKHVQKRLQLVKCAMA